MSAWFHYLVRASLCLIPFYAVYFLLFRRLTFFRWNRLYLLGSLPASFLIPLLTIRVPAAVPSYTPPVMPVIMHHEIGDTIARLPVQATATVWHISWMQVMTGVYAAGVAIMLARLLMSLWRVYSMIRQGEKQRWNGLTVIESESIRLNASFFHYIFMKPHLSEKERLSVLAHERIHAMKGHSADILLIEALKTICWFHPVIYHYKLLLQRAHEFEVDHTVTLQVDKREYAQLLLSLQSPQYIPVANLFSSSELKERIQMLFTPKSNTMKRLLYLLLIPVILVSVMSFSLKNKYTPAVTPDTGKTGPAARDQHRSPLTPASSVVDKMARPADLPSGGNTLTGKPAQKAEGDAGRPGASPQVAVATFQPVSGIDLKDVRKIKPGVTSSEEIQKLFGNPSGISMDIHSQYLTYEATDCTLQISVDAKKDVVTDYQYRKVNNTPRDTTINVADVRKIKPGSTRASEVESLFGAPSDISVSAHAENWNYRAKNAILSVAFSSDMGGEVVNYDYRKTPPSKSVFINYSAGGKMESLYDVDGQRMQAITVMGQRTPAEVTVTGQPMPAVVRVKGYPAPPPVVTVTGHPLQPLQPVEGSDTLQSTH